MSTVVGGSGCGGCVWTARWALRPGWDTRNTLFGGRGGVAVGFDVGVGVVWLVGCVGVGFVVVELV